MKIDIDDILKGFKEQYKQAIIDSGHNSSGNLANSMHWGLEVGADKYVVTITLPEYAKYLEDGTQPHWPNIEAIKKWIKIKPILPRPMNGKLPTENQLAYMIGRKISKVGTKPAHLIRQSMEQFGLVGKLYDRIAGGILSEIEGLQAEIV